MKKFFKKISSGTKKLFEIISNKWLLKGTTTVILVALVIASYIGINYLAKEARVEDIDVTPEKKYSLSDDTKNELQKLENEITIQLINMKSQEFIYVKEYVNKFRNASDKINVEEIDDSASRLDLQTKYDLTVSDQLIVVKNGEREKKLTLNELYTYISSSRAVNATEDAILNAITSVTIEQKPHVYVLTGKTEYQPELTLGIIANKLMDESNDIDLLDIMTTGKIPDDCACLIITTLKQDLSDLERDKILEYINNGGKVLMLTSQGLLNVDTPNLDQILAQYGITLNQGVIFEQDTSKKLFDTPNMIIADANASFMSNLDKMLKIFVVSPGKIQFDDEAKLKEMGVTYEVIAATSEKSFVRTQYDIESMTRTDKDSEEGSSIIGALATKAVSDDKQSKLIIYSDETFSTTIELPNVGFMAKQQNNEDVIMNSISHLTEREDTIKTRQTDETQTFTVTDQQDVIIRTIIFSVPVLIIILGIAVWIYRRRKI